jgi:hypothetical protein
VIGKCVYEKVNGHYVNKTAETWNVFQHLFAKLTNTGKVAKELNDAAAVYTGTMATSHYFHTPLHELERPLKK